MNDLTHAVSPLAWLGLTAVIAAMLAIDLLMHRDERPIGLREAATWSGVWIAAGLAFGAIIWVWQGQQAAGAYYSGYLIEKALSIDNVFIFAMIFSFFAVPAGLQHRVLFFGVVGALGFRLLFIFLGVEILHAAFWTAYLFGAFLIYTGYVMAFRHDQQTQPDRTLMVRLLRRVIPTEASYNGKRFFTRRDGRLVGTLLLVALIAIEATDLIFAIDSVAAVLAITTSTFLVWSANAFAVLGLRSLYFCLAGLLRRFVHLHYGLALLLVFAGVKLILSATPVGKLPIPLTLGVIAATIGISIATSLRATRTPRRPPAAPATGGPDDGGALLGGETQRTPTPTP